MFPHLLGVDWGAKGNKRREMLPKVSASYRPYKTMVVRVMRLLVAILPLSGIDADIGVRFWALAVSLG